MRWVWSLAFWFVSIASCNIQRITPIRLIFSTFCRKEISCYSYKNNKGKIYSIYRSKCVFEWLKMWTDRFWVAYHGGKKTKFVWISSWNKCAKRIWGKGIIFSENKLWLTKLLNVYSTFVSKSGCHCLAMKAGAPKFSAPWPFRLQPLQEVVL